MRFSVAILKVEFLEGYHTVFITSFYSKCLLPGTVKVNTVLKLELLPIRNDQKHLKAGSRIFSNGK